MARVLRLSAFEDLYRVAQLRVAIEMPDGSTREYAFELTSADQVLDAADKLRSLGNTMLRHAPRPQQEGKP